MTVAMLLPVVVAADVASAAPAHQDPALDAIHGGTFTVAQYDALAVQIDAAVKSIIANCPMNAPYDEQLHLVLTEVVTGTQLMQGKQGDAARADGAAKIVAALNAYGGHFRHPGWTALAH